jgi:hypothetical protein
LNIGTYSKKKKKMVCYFRLSDFIMSFIVFSIWPQPNIGIQMCYSTFVKNSKKLLVCTYITLKTNNKILKMSTHSLYIVIEWKLKPNLTPPLTTGMMPTYVELNNITHNYLLTNIIGIFYQRRRWCLLVVTNSQPHECYC